MRSILICALVLSLGAICYGQNIQTIHFKVGVSSMPLSIAGGDIELDGLMAGTTYSAVPDGAGSLIVTPNDGSVRVSNSNETVIRGDLNAKVLISFVLPTHLYPSGGTGNGFVVTRFTSNSAAWGPSGAENNYFDPKNPTQVSLDALGAVYVSLGGVFEVPYTTGDDTYVGDALLTAQYTGL